MKLKKYDGKCVKIIDIDGIEYEGICYYNTKDYCYHEYARNEDCLDILNILFYRSEIKDIVSLENINGPYGKFTSAYGNVEKMIVEDGVDMLEEAFEGEENDHIYRLLLCLERTVINKEIIHLLKKLIKNNKDERIVKKAKEMIQRYDG